MNKLVGLACFLVVLGAAAFAFSPRPMPVFPATAIECLAAAAAGRRRCRQARRRGRRARLSSFCPTTTGATGAREVADRRHADRRALRRCQARLGGGPRRGDPDDRGWRRDLEAGARGARRAEARCSTSGSTTPSAASPWAPTAPSTRPPTAARAGRRRRRFAGDQHLNALAGGADGKLLLVGEAGTILRSDDAGRRPGRR